MKKLLPYERVILSAKKQFIAIAGKEAWAREIIFLRTFIPMLTACTPDSIQQAVLNIAIIGITLNPIFQEAYLIERDSKCFLDFTYRGLIKVATSEGAITSLSAGIVYTWDSFAYDQGTNAFINHTQNFNPPKDPDEIARNPKLIWEYLKCAYSIATFPNGLKDIVILPKFKLLKTWNGIAKSAINEMWPEEWIRKTAVRYHSKTLVRSTKLVTAVSILNEHEGVTKKRKSESRLMKRLKDA